MRGFLAFLFLALVALGAGAVGYNIGVSQAVTTAAGSAGSTIVYPAWHWGGFLFFPFAFFLFPLFFLCFFGFLAFVFGPRRRWGHGGWGRYGYGPGPDESGSDSRRQWIADAHRRLHEEEARSASESGANPSASASSPAGGATTPTGGASTPPGSQSAR